MSTWAKQNNGNYLNPITGHWWKKEGDKWQLYEEYGQYKMITVSEEDFKEIEKKLSGCGSDARLRDQFAMVVAGHIWAVYQTDGTARDFDNWREGVAIEAYRLADEMLKEREE